VFCLRMDANEVAVGFGEGVVVVDGAFECCDGQVSGVSV